MYNKVSEWIDGVLSAPVPDEVVAFCFNLYENDECCWSMDLIGAAGFDPDDQDWACDEVFTNREDPLSWSAETDWEEVLETMTEYVEKYLIEGEYAPVLKDSTAVGIGFVDGDITIVYVNAEA